MNTSLKKEEAEAREKGIAQTRREIEERGERQTRKRWGQENEEETKLGDGTGVHEWREKEGEWAMSV